MYNIDSRALKTSIGVLVYSSLQPDDKVEERVSYYFPLVLDIMLGVMNSKHRNIDDALYDEMLNYSDDATFYLFSELIYEEVKQMKQQFLLAGFDPRLKYKIITKNIPRTVLKLHAIAMDLEFTAATLNEIKDSDDIDVQDAVSDQPSIEQLNEIFGSWENRV